MYRAIIDTDVTNIVSSLDASSAALSGNASVFGVDITEIFGSTAQCFVQICNFLNAI